MEETIKVRQTNLQRCWQWKDLWESAARQRLHRWHEAPPGQAHRCTGIYCHLCSPGQSPLCPSGCLSPQWWRLRPQHPPLVDRHRTRDRRVVVTETAPQKACSRPPCSYLDISAVRSYLRYKCRSTWVCWRCFPWPAVLARGLEPCWGLP